MYWARRTLEKDQSFTQMRGALSHTVEVVFRAPREDLACSKERTGKGQKGCGEEGCKVSAKSGT